MATKKKDFLDTVAPKPTLIPTAPATPAPKPETAKTPLEGAPKAKPEQNGTSGSASKHPEVLRDNDGKSIGVRIPGEPEYKNLKQREISALIAAYYSNQGKGGTATAEAESPEVMKEKSIVEEQASQVGEVSMVEQAQGDTALGQISQDISENQVDRAAIRKIPVINVLNKFTGAIPGGSGIKNSILGLAGENQELRRYLDDYSNYDTVERIKNEITIADGEIAAAKKLSLTPGYAAEANQLYTHALAKKNAAYKNLKRISQTDQRRYVEDVFDKMAIIQSYFDTQKLNDDIEIRNNILKAGGI